MQAARCAAAGSLLVVGVHGAGPLACSGRGSAAVAGGVWLLRAAFTLLGEPSRERSETCPDGLRDPGVPQLPTVF